MIWLQVVKNSENSKGAHKNVYWRGLARAEWFGGWEIQPAILVMIYSWDVNEKILLKAILMGKQTYG
jgi:hypothetical protein